MSGQQFLPIILPFANQQSQQQACDNRIPARIRAALEFLTHLSAKTQERVAVNDVVVQTIEGQKLTQEESAAQDAACHLLGSYFDGKTKPNEVESLEIEGMKRSLAPTGQGQGVLIRCLACDIGLARAECMLCRGSGYSLIFPSAEKRL